jgi:alpha-1,2-mannosyltransferase
VANRSTSGWELPSLLLVVAVACAVRGRPLVELDRFGLMGYDQTAYFAGGRALTRGYLPYRDFVHLQPPGILLVLAPFALIGSWGFTAAKVLVVVMGAASTALLWRIARPWVGPIGAVVAALAYALNRSSIGAHRYVLIDPFVTVALLGSVALLAPDRAASRRVVLAGALLGVAVGFKVSAIVPVAAVAIALALAGTADRRDRLVRLGGGFVAGVAALVLPFAVFAPGKLFHQVVWSQAGRNRAVGLVDRLLSAFWFAGKPPATHEALAVACVVLAAVALTAWGFSSRSFPGVLGATWLVLGTGFVLAAPQFYEHYGELLAPPLALLAGGFVASGSARRATNPLPVVAAWGAGAVLVIGGLSTALHPLPAPFLHAPGEYALNTRVADATIGPGECVVTDSPELVLALPALTGYSSSGTGPTVDPYAAAVVAHTPPPVPPASLRRFERAMARCPWFAAPRYWSPAGGYPNWSAAMRAQFRRDHELVRATVGMELWRSVEVAPQRDSQP